MAIVVISKGNEETKIVDSRVTTATPIAMCIQNEKRETEEMGIGLSYDSGKLMFWGLMYPLSVVNSVRAVEVANQVKVFSNYTLSHCYEVVQSSNWGNGKYIRNNDAYQEILKQVDKVLLEKIANAPIRNLEAILKLCEDKKIDYVKWDIEREVEKKRLELTPFVRGILERGAESLQKTHG